MCRTSREAEMTELTDARPIVVGVDGSGASLAALRWAVPQAHRLGAPIVAVHARERTDRLRAVYAPLPAHRAPADEWPRPDRVWHAVLTEPGVRVVTAEGLPTAVLLRYADDALMLVVGRGAQGDGRLPGLGPVARDCVRKARCPVVTVPEPRAAPRSVTAPVRS
jgi:nucleotide-binding universal stress UspA family protein